MKEFKHFHLECGIGGFAKGLQEAMAEYGTKVAGMRLLGGVDVDPEACQDFEKITGVAATVLNLFTREDYIAFHGQEPPVDWREATAEDLRVAAGYEYPDILAMSPPCKGFSGLLPGEKAAGPKYQALNRLVFRSLHLSMEAWGDDPPAIILLENVPRIVSRGAGLLAQVRAILGRYGYVFDPPAGNESKGYHDCGELGGLGQHRKRFLLIARQPAKCPGFVYNVRKERVRSIGEILGPVPLPDDPVMGPMHRLPRLQFKTWVRLALIPAGGDWRDLQHIKSEEYGLEYVPRGGGPYGVQDWDGPAATVTGHPGPRGSNAASVADPRLDHDPREGVFRVQRFDEPSTTVTGQARVGASNGAACVADPRLQERYSRHPAVYRVVRFTDPAPCVTGTRFGSGAAAVADPRVGEGYAGKRGVLGWDHACTTVTGTPDIQSGAQSVADPRTGMGPGTHHNILRVTPWGKQAGTVTGAARPAAGALTVADPRLPDGTGDKFQGSPGLMGVLDWDDPAQTVTGARNLHSGTTAVADPRVPKDTENGVWVIIALDGTWHRPLTTLELAALQGFDVISMALENGAWVARPLVLAGNNDARWRERIGNAVPPPAARAIGERILMALLNERGDLMLSNEGIWVAPGAPIEPVIEDEAL